MQGHHARRERPKWDSPHAIYCLLLDVAGEDEGALGGRMEVMALENPRRDATVLTIVEVDLATLSDPLLAAPTYRCVDRRRWVGVKHVTLYGAIRATALAYRARYLVADATGVGAGLVSFLSKTLEGVIPFEFNRASKSKLGWDFRPSAKPDAGRITRPSRATRQGPASGASWSSASTKRCPAKASCCAGGCPTARATRPPPPLRRAGPRRHAAQRRAGGRAGRAALGGRHRPHSRSSGQRTRSIMNGGF